MKIQMLILNFAIFIVFASGFIAPVYAAGCNPSDDEVTFFQHGNYGGRCSVLGIGTYKNSAQMRVANDSVSSFVVGKNVQVTVCNNATNDISQKNFKCQTFRSSMASLGNSRVGNDSISSATIVVKQTVGDVRAPGRCYPGDNSNAVAVYQHPNFGGKCKVLGVGSYENAKRMNFSNDSISSIEFAQNSGVKVNVCKDSNFGGRCEKFRATDINLYDNRIGDNSISSINVKRW